MHSSFDLHHGDCLDILRTLPDNSIDAVVTDPPYGLAFMGKKWDYDVPSEDIWRECLRVLKPGGHLLAFAGTRTQHRMAVRIEDAGFEIRDMIAWVYGSGFPKSLDVSKAIDKAAGAEREVTGHYMPPADSDYYKKGFKPTDPNGGLCHNASSYGAGAKRIEDRLITAPATDAAKQWHGWGTALKPALEPITVARKPLIGTVAENVLTWGTGGVNVDGCRIASSQNEPNARQNKTILGQDVKDQVYSGGWVGTGNSWDGTLGRWPANLIHDGSDEVMGLFPQAGGGFGVRGKGGQTYASGKGFANTLTVTGQDVGYGDTGSAARFFYCAKASKRDRDEGCEGMKERQQGAGCYGNGLGNSPKIDGLKHSPIKNHHPTVKPTDLMRYLCRLVTPPGGIVLDPFTGSGSTGKGAILEGFRFVGIEREAEYIDIARARIQHAVEQISTQPALDL